MTTPQLHAQFLLLYERLGGNVGNHFLADEIDVILNRAQDKLIAEWKEEPTKAEAIRSVVKTATLTFSAAGSFYTAPLPGDFYRWIKGFVTGSGKIEIVNPDDLFAMIPSPANLTPLAGEVPGTFTNSLLTIVSNGQATPATGTLLYVATPNVITLAGPINPSVADSEHHALLDVAVQIARETIFPPNPQ